MRNAVDFSYARPYAVLLQARQLDALGYTGNARPDQAYLDDLTAHGVLWTFIQEVDNARAQEGYTAGTYDAQFADRRADQRSYPITRSVVYVVSDGSRYDPASGGDAIADYGEGVARTSRRPFLAYGNAYALSAFERGVARVPGNFYVGGPWGVRTWDPPGHACLVQEPNIPSPIPDTDFNSVVSDYTGTNVTHPGGFLMALTDDQQQEVLDVCRMLRDGVPAYGVPKLLPEIMAISGSVKAAPTVGVEAVAPLLSRIRNDLTGAVPLMPGELSTRALLEAAATKTAAPIPEAGAVLTPEEQAALKARAVELRAVADALDAVSG